MALEVAKRDSTAKIHKQNKKDETAVKISNSKKKNDCKGGRYENAVYNYLSPSSNVRLSPVKTPLKVRRSALLEMPEVRRLHKSIEYTHAHPRHGKQRHRRRQSGRILYKHGRQFCIIEKYSLPWRWAVFNRFFQKKTFFKKKTLSCSRIHNQKKTAARSKTGSVRTTDVVIKEM